VALDEIQAAKGNRFIYFFGIFIDKYPDRGHPAGKVLDNDFYKLRRHISGTFAIEDESHGSGS
jgi:hypothetical protein